MGWRNTGREDGADGSPGDRPAGPGRLSADLNAVAAMCVFQLPAIGLAWLIRVQLGDDYGIPAYNGFGTILVLGCLLVVAPLVLPFVGLVHGIVQIVPAAFLARAAVRHAGGPVWAWHLMCTATLGVGWAGLTALLCGWPFTTTAPLFAALGVLPVLGLAHLRRRTRITGRPQGFRGAWLPSLVASVGLFLLTFVGGVLATVTGLVEEYEPPALSAEQLTGVWRGADGSVLWLDQGGEAELTELPVESRSGDWSTDPFDVCDGTGSWSPGTQDGRDAVLVRLDGACGRDTYWTVGGTERAPELFALFGDPDAGDLHILTKD